MNPTCDITNYITNSSLTNKKISCKNLSICVILFELTNVHQRIKLIALVLMYKR